MNENSSGRPDLVPLSTQKSVGSRQYVCWQDESPCLSRLLLTWVVRVLIECNLMRQQGRDIRINEGQNSHYFEKNRFVF